MKEIHSTKNQFIKEIKKLQKRKYRELKQQYLIEGEHLLEEAIKAQAPIEWVLFSQKAFAETNFSIPDDKTCLVTDEVLASISSVPTPQGIVAIVAMQAERKHQSFERPVLLLDNVQDPGNVGTMIRTADAAGFEAVILGDGSADIYNEKVLRAMQGSHFHITIFRKELGECMEELKEQEISIVGTELNKQAQHYDEITKMKRFALLMGNEGQGVQKELLQQTTLTTYIPIYGSAESLNVAVAAGILMYSLKK